MRRPLTAVLLSCLLPLALPGTPAEARPVKVPLCQARVVHSEELPFAPPGFWLARVTLQVVPPAGAPFVTTVSHDIPWQQSAPRAGDTYRVRCDGSLAVIYQ